MVSAFSGGLDTLELEQSCLKLHLASVDADPQDKVSLQVQITILLILSH